MLTVVLGGLVVLAAAVGYLRLDARWIGWGSLTLGGFLLAALPAITRLAPSTRTPTHGLLVTGTDALRMVAPVLAGVLALTLLTHAALGLHARSRDRGTLAALVLGVVTVVLVILGVILVEDSAGQPLSFLLGLILLLGTGWAGFLYVAYALHSVVYAATTPLRIRGERRPNFVLVHGIKLRGGEVVPALQRRMEGGVAAWRRLHAQDPAALLVVSGGHHPDERRSEADAMAEIAREMGVPESALVVEDEAANTRDNLWLGIDLARARLGPDARGLSVTSGYHVARTAVLARHLDLPIEVAPSTTPWLRIPSGYLSEFGALLMLRPAASLVSALVVVLPVPLTIGYVLAVT